jgi:LemA protein
LVVENLVWIIPLAVILLVVMWWIGTYNGLVSRRNETKNSWSQIDVQLKRRYDLIPNLVETAKGYMKHERETLEAVVKARQTCVDLRSAGNVGELMKAEGTLAGSLRQLFAVAENYPELKANQTFQQLQTRISSLENAIADRREFYNESVNINNVRIEQFPDAIVASMFGFKAAQLLEFTEEESARALFNDASIRRHLQQPSRPTRRIRPHIALVHARKLAGQGERETQAENATP